MAIRVNFTPTRVDLIRLGYLGLRDRPAILWPSAALFIVLPWLTALGGAATGDLDWSSIMLLAALPPATVLFFALLPVWLFRSSKTFYGPHDYVFSDQDIHATGPGFETHISWNVLTHFRLHPFGVLLRSNKVPMVTIPGRAISNSERHELIALFERKGLVGNA